MKRLPPVKMKRKKVRSPDRGSLLLQEPLFMNERALMAIMSVLEGFTEPPRSDWPQHEAEEFTFSRWAVEEMLNQVWDHPWTLASDTIEQFALKLKVYAITSKTEKQRRIFDIAAETAWELLDDIKEVER